LAAIIASGGSALGQPDKRACLDTYVEAQSDRQAGKLIAARAAAVTCGSESCPDVLRGDCVTWLRELDASIPTVVFSASSPDGRDVTDARVSVDGRDVVARVAGEAVAMDPGEHIARCEAEGYKPVEIRVVAAQGAKNRAVRFEMELARSTVSPMRAATAGPRPVRPLTYALGAIGLVGLAVWGGIGASAFWGNPSVETLDRCKPNCNPSDRSDVQRKLVMADIAGATALLGLGVALALYLTRPVVVVTPLRDGLLLGGSTRF